MKIGVIADDFTGATDAASFIVKNGLTAIQFSGVPDNNISIETDTCVIALKSRSCSVAEAIEASLQACRWLKDQGCTLIYFKYCSTFDSTSDGNIGPVVDALMRELNTSKTIVCPALPVNGRTVYQGHLFVYEQLLSESGMRNHPITPMTESNLIKLMEAQSQGKAGLVKYEELTDVSSIKTRFLQLERQSYKYFICDTITQDNLNQIGEACADFDLVTGGSGLVGAIAKAASNNAVHNQAAFVPRKQGKGLIISGSCSVMTNKQVEEYSQHAPSYQIDVEMCINNPQYVNQVLGWVLSQSDVQLYPLVYATVPANHLSAIQEKYGATASEKIEALFHKLVCLLQEYEYHTIISAGGETSGTVTQALNINGLLVGQEISPGVPWVSSLDGKIALALKSGNFGDEAFFKKAQEMMI